MKSVVAALGFSGLVNAQAPGTLKTERHPSLSVATCTKSGGCTSADKEVVIDSNWRWIHESGKPTNCYTGNEWDSSICPDAETCSKACVLEGADEEYTDTYGIKANGNSLDLGFVTKGQYSKNVGSRTYLMKDEDTYETFKLKNKEFTFDVDVTGLPCGLNGALYFVQMDADGGKSKYGSKNTAGAKYGTGYCDAQCPHDLKWINGETNMLDWQPSATDPNAGIGKYGTCCVEMDIWEANEISTAFTPHSCDVKEQTRCEGVDCGDNPDHRFDGKCDKNGCDFQTYRLGNETFYGNSSSFELDSSKVMTVITQFITVDGTDDGALKEIKRFYKQDGKIIETPTIPVGGFGSFNSITEDYCKAEVGTFQDKTNFIEKGGLSSMDDAFEKGVVLVMSIWDDHDVNMLWLDSTYPTDGSQKGSRRGTCPITSGSPKDVEKNHADAHVTYSNIRFGEIGSTVSGAKPAPSPSLLSPAPVPAGCPGGSMNSCMSVCPNTPIAAYSACVKECGKRCTSSTLLAAKPAKSLPWAHCTAVHGCVTGWECTQRNEATAAQCTPVEALTEAFMKTKPNPTMIQEFMTKGTTRFPASGLAA